MQKTGSNKQSALEGTYSEAFKYIGSCYNANELLVLFRFYVPPIVMLETGIKGEPKDADSNESDPIYKMWQCFLNIGTRMRIYERELQYLKEVSIWLEDNGFSKLGQLTELFLISLYRFKETDPPNSYSFFDILPIDCKKCDIQNEHMIWNIINTKLREDLQQFVSTGEVFKHRCPYCGDVQEGSGIFFYCDPYRNDYLLLIPSPDEETMDAQDGTARYLNDLPKEFRDSKSTVIFVSSYIPGPWQNADDCNIVFCLYDIQQLLEIINAPLIVDCVNLSIESLKNPLYRLADQEFLSESYERAAQLYAKAFLNDQKQVSWLYNICAALHNLGESDKAAFLKSRTDALKPRLRETGVIYDTRENWPIPTNPTAEDLSIRIAEEG